MSSLFSLPDLIRTADEAVSLGLRLKNLYSDYQENQRKKEIKKILKTTSKLIGKMNSIYTDILLQLEVRKTKKGKKEFFKNNDLGDVFLKVYHLGDSIEQNMYLDYFDQFQELRTKIKFKVLSDNYTVKEEKELAACRTNYDKFLKKLNYSKKLTEDAQKALKEHIHIHFN